MSPVDIRTTCRTDADRDVIEPCATRSEIPCRRDDPDLWFAEAPDRLEQAKQLCSRCPIRSWCLDAALDRAEPWGVWGGEIFDQGVIIARKRSRGRPRKTPAAAVA